MREEKVIKICKAYKGDFWKEVRGLNFEAKGIFNSEMLLFVAITKKLGVTTIIESGRARGQSTKIIAEIFKDPSFEIVSLEYDKYTKDTLIAMKRLKGYKNLKLLYGDSRKVLPQFIKSPCTVIIDGPKGDGAIKLALKLIEDKNVKAIFIHDLHKDSPHRSIVERVFNQTFFSDDADFVKEFEGLDVRCWRDQKKYRTTKDWAPYKRGEKKMKSYSSTLGVIFNNKNPIDVKEKDEYLESLKQSSCLTPYKLFKKFEFGTKRIVRNIIFIVPYYLTKWEIIHVEAISIKDQ